MDIQQAKQHLAVTAKRGFPLLVSGFLFWLAEGIGGLLLPERMVMWLYVASCVLVFPLGILIGRVVKASLISRANPLSALAGLVESMQLLFVPLVLLVELHQSHWVPVVMGLLVGGRMLAYVWLYESRAYLLLCLGTVVVATVNGFLGNDAAFFATPFAVAGIYFLALGVLHFEAQKDVPPS